jgi:predicted lipoprotein with Yx(FWY)xxD motif
MRNRAWIPAFLIGVMLATTIAAASASNVRTNVRSIRTRYGRVLTDSVQFSLYIYCTYNAPSAPNRMSCRHGHSSPKWRPLIAHGRLFAGKHVHQSKLGTRRLADGRLQVTYYGQPLYLYKGDRHPRQTNGEMSGGDRPTPWWWVLVHPDGQGVFIASP